MSKNISMRGIVLVCLFSVNACWSVQQKVTQAQAEQLAKGKMFNALKVRQKEVVNLWLQAREETDRDARQALEAKATARQKDLQNEVAKFKEMSKLSLELLKRRYEQTQKQVVPDMDPQIREQTKNMIVVRKRILRSKLYLLQQMRMTYKIELERHRQDLAKAREELLNIHNRWLDRLKEIGNEIKQARERKHYVQQLQYQSHQELVREAEVQEDETRVEALKALGHYSHTKEAHWDEVIKERTEELARVRAWGEKKEYPPPLMKGYNEKEWKESFVDPVANGIKLMQEDYRNLKWRGIGGLIESIKGYEREIEDLEAQLGGKDAALQRMAAEQLYLEGMVEYKFVVELPDPKGFVDHLYEAIQTVNETLTSVKEIKALYDIVQSGNPWKILDVACEKLYGQNFGELFAEKLGVSEYLDNKWVKLAISGKFDKDEVWKAVGEGVLPEGMYNKLEALDRMRRDPQGFAGDALYSEVEKAVMANPYLRDTVEDIKKVQAYVKNPGVLREEIQAHFEAELLKVAKDSDMYKQLESEYEQYQAQYQEIVDAQKQRSEVFQQAVANAVEQGRKTVLVGLYTQQPRGPEKDKAYWKGFTQRVHKLVQSSE